MKLQRLLVLLVLALPRVLSASDLKFEQGDKTLLFTAPVGLRDFNSVAEQSFDFDVPQALRGLVKSPAKYLIDSKGILRVTVPYNPTPTEEPFELPFSVKDKDGHVQLFTFKGTLMPTPPKSTLAGGQPSPPPSRHPTAQPKPATIRLGGLNATYDGTKKAVTAETDPLGLEVKITYDGKPEQPHAAGKYKVHAQISTPGYSGSAAGELIINAARSGEYVSFWQTFLNEPLFWLIGVMAAAAFAIACYGLYGWFRDWRLSKRSGESPANSGQQGPPAQKPMQPGSAVIRVSPDVYQEPPVTRPEPSNELNRRALGDIEQLKSEAKAIEKEVNRLIIWGTAWGTADDLETLFAAIPSSKPSSRGRSNSRVPDEQRLAACVNHWIKTGGGDRQRLLAMAEDVNLRAELATHKDLAKSLADLNRFAYRFESSSEEAGWIWIPIEGSSERFAIPADVAFFQATQPADLVDRLFEGMRSATSGFRFERFYRPCHLKPVPGEPGIYERVTRGVLMLAGGERPNMSEPPDYQSLEKRNSNDYTASTDGMTVARLLTDNLSRLRADSESTRSDLQSLREDIKRLGDKIETVRPAETAKKVLDADYRDLKKKMEDLHVLKGDWEQALSLAGEAEKVAKKALTLAQVAFQRTAKVEKPAEDFDNANAVELPPARGSDLKSALAREANAAPATPTPAPKQAASAVVGPPASAKTPADLAEAVNLVSPAETVEAAPDQFVGRLKEAETNLTDCVPGIPVRLVHLKYDSSADTFEVHATTALESGEVICQRCAKPQTWQLAVCVGKPGDTEVQILFAPCWISPQQYSGAYKALIEDCRSAAFRIGRVLSPALLRLAEGEKYTVNFKLRWSA